MTVKMKEPNGYGGNAVVVEGVSLPVVDHHVDAPESAVEELQRHGWTQEKPAAPAKPVAPAKPTAPHPAKHK